MSYSFKSESEFQGYWNLIAYEQHKMRQAMEDLV